MPRTLGAWQPDQAEWLWQWAANWDDATYASILADKRNLTRDIVVDIGTPVLHKSVRYNCRVWLLNRRVLFVRPKVSFAL